MYTTVGLHGKGAESTNNAPMVRSLSIRPVCLLTGRRGGEKGREREREMFGFPPIVDADSSAVDPSFGIF